MVQLYDIVKRNAVITQRKAGQNMTAGTACYLSSSETVKPTPDQNCGGYAFDGVTTTTASSGNWISVATAPSEVYVNASSAITAGHYLTPAVGGRMMNVSISDIGARKGDIVICGKAITTAATGAKALVKLMDAPNISMWNA